MKAQSKQSKKNKQTTGLVMHIQGKKLNEILRLLKRLKLPSSIKKIAGEDYFNISVTCNLIEARTLIPRLKKAGCENVIQSPIARFLP